MEKLEMKASVMRNQTKKVTMQLKLKMETGDDLHEIDFDQLKIENTQYVEKIDERNNVSGSVDVDNTHLTIILGSASTEKSFRGHSTALERSFRLLGRMMFEFTLKSE